MKFCGKWKGKGEITIINGCKEFIEKISVKLYIKEINNNAFLLKGIINKKINFQLVGFYNKKTGEINSINPDGNGITTTYFDGKNLIHSVSLINNKGQQVINIKLKKH
jgi:hypothetical protein